MSAWAECFVSVRFDLDVGPVVEHVSPAGALTPAGERILAQSAFPDCNPDCGHEFVFFFTVRDTVLTSSRTQTPQGLGSPRAAVGSDVDCGGESFDGSSTSDALAGNDNSVAFNGSFPRQALGVSCLTGTRESQCTLSSSSFTRNAASTTAASVAPELLLGAAHYRQKRDSAVPRGYVQQVVLLLSRLPYLLIHELIMRVVVPRFNQCCHLSPDVARTPVASVLGPSPCTVFGLDGSFHPAHATQADVLNMTMNELSSWPSPHPHVHYSVSLLNQNVTFVTPPRETRPMLSSFFVRRRRVVLDDRVCILDRSATKCFSQSYLPLYYILGDHLSNLTKVWELLIAHRHLLILSNTPSMSSAAAVAVASLVMPIRFVGDLRAYFTVQDADFTALSQLGKPSDERPFPEQYSVVVSGTNPFFVRAFAGWKNLLSICDPFSHRAVTSRGLVSPLSPQDDAALERNQSTYSVDSNASSSTASPSLSQDWKATHQWGLHNLFKSHHEFLLDHLEHAQLLQSRVSLCLKAPAELQEAAAAQVDPQNPIQSITMADDMVRKFFFSLTTDFLRPIDAWFESTVKAQCEPFQLCYAQVVDTPLFHASKCLLFVREHRKRLLAPAFRSRPYRVMKRLYEQFCNGVLFRSHVEQLIDAYVMQEIRGFRCDEWAAGTAESKRVDMFINLLGLAQREWDAPDPDLILLTEAIAVLSEMAVCCPEPLQQGLLQKVDLLRW